MPLIDSKFRQNRRKYVLQCLIAILTIIAILGALDVERNTAVIASLGATAFIIFAMPAAISSTPRRVLGGYAVGIALGVLFGYLASLGLIGKLLHARDVSHIIFGGFAVGFSIFTMVITNTEHPPAAGIALGLVINDSDNFTLLVITVAVVIMILVKRLLRKHLIDLV